MFHSLASTDTPPTHPEGEIEIHQRTLNRAQLFSGDDGPEQSEFVGHSREAVPRRDLTVPRTIVSLGQCLP